MNTFPTLSSAPRIEGFTDEYNNETAIADARSGKPLLIPKTTFDGKIFIFGLRHVSDTDKNTLEVFLTDDGMNNFGSYRGYSTFGLDLDLEKQIINAYVEHMYLYERSMRVLQTEFTPYLLHYLYKPNGIRFMGLFYNFNTVVAS